jgi:hypothetical protein
MEISWILSGRDRVLQQLGMYKTLNERGNVELKVRMRIECHHVLVTVDVEMRGMVHGRRGFACYLDDGAFE